MEYAVEGSSNYIAWKDSMEEVLDDNGLKEFINAKIPKPTSSDAAVMAHGKRRQQSVEGFCWRA